MSVKVSAWVWERSTHRGTVKLLLVALADFANDSGICWPSAATLAERIGESERHTRRLLKELVEAGDLIAAPGGGRGNTTRYGIAIGLNDRQRSKLAAALQNSDTENSVTQNSVSENSVSHNTDMENSDIPAQKQCPTGTETVTSGHASEGQHTASERPKPAQKPRGIHHRSVMDPSIRTPRPSGAAPSADHQQLMTAYQEWLGYPIPNGGKEGAAARKLLKAGYTVEQVDDAYHRLKMQPFYADKHVSLAVVFEQIGAVRTAQKDSRNGTSRPLPHALPPAGELATWTTYAADDSNGRPPGNADRLPGVR